METVTSAPGYERVACYRDFERTPRGVLLHAETDAGTSVEVALDPILPRSCSPRTPIGCTWRLAPRPGEPRPAPLLRPRPGGGGV